jgi:dTDP-4-amino-4,6-dideoxygalactose transaminase
MSEVHANAIGRVSEYLTEFLADPRTFRGQQLRGGGPVAEFEQLLTERCGFPFCVTTSNATSALLGLGLMMDVSGKIVLFPKSHWEGSVAAFRLLGAIIKRYPEGNPEATAAKELPHLIVIGSDLMSRSRVRNLKRLSRSQNCIILEDSTRLPGITTTMDDVSHADVQVVSFGPGKPLALGEGGAALFRNLGLRKRFVSMTQHPEKVHVEYGTRKVIPKVCAFGRIHPLAALIGREILQNNIP